MRPLRFGLVIVLALLMGAGIGYAFLGVEPGSTTTTLTTTSFATSTTVSTTRSTSTSTTVSTTTETETSTVTTYPLNASQEIRSACTYLASNYNSTVGLIAETPSHARYFLYSDNFLASSRSTLVLSRDCNNPDLAKSINATLSKYNPAAIPNQFMVFRCKQYFLASVDYLESGQVWTTVNDGPPPPLNESYADIAFLQAIYDVRCGQSTGAALDAFNAGAREYNGIGFNDTAFRVGSSKGVYQTYKLALYIYTARFLNQTVPLSAFVNLARMQAPSGGFYTGYDASFSNDGTTTNTETTCLVIMALEAVSG